MATFLAVHNDPACTEACRASVAEALRAFSIETVVAYSAKSDVSAQLASGLDTHAKLFAPVA